MGNSGTTGGKTIGGSGGGGGGLSSTITISGISASGTTGVTGGRVSVITTSPKSGMSVMSGITGVIGLSSVITTSPRSGTVASGVTTLGLVVLGPWSAYGSYGASGRTLGGKSKSVLGKSVAGLVYQSGNGPGVTSNGG